MIYTIEETDLERQRLLAQVFNPVSMQALENILLKKDLKMLDVGCGLGHTTLMLNERFPNSTIIGLDGDTSLIAIATEENSVLHSNLQFVIGDALQLPFNDDSFDFVFTRCCLGHLASALHGLKEMKRVCKPGGIVFAQESDINSIVSYTESWAYQKHRDYLTSLIGDSLLGRKLVSYFTQLQMHHIQHYAISVIGDQNNEVKRFLTMTGSAIGKALVKKGLATIQEHEAYVKELERAQHDDDITVIMAPSICVWGIKP